MHCSVGKVAARCRIPVHLRVAKDNETENGQFYYNKSNGHASPEVCHHDREANISTLVEHVEVAVAKNAFLP